MGIVVTNYGVCQLFSHDCSFTAILKGLAMIFAGQKNPFIIFRSKEIYIYFKTNNKILTPTFAEIMKENRGFDKGTLTVFLIS